MNEHYDWNAEDPSHQDTYTNDGTEEANDYRLGELWLWFKDAYESQNPEAVRRWFLTVGNEFLQLTRWAASRPPRSFRKEQS